ncbi:MAG: transaldolase [Acidimicrobiales bacterium]
MRKGQGLGIKLFADGADLQSLQRWMDDPRIRGFTTNPTLMGKAGLRDYESFAKEFLSRVDRQPVSFEVVDDDLEEMVRQARIITSWGDNVYVKVPVTNTSGEPTDEIVRRLSEDGVKVNVTAIFTVAQVERVVEAVSGGAPSYISVFAGRIADAGVDPVPLVAEALTVMETAPRAEMIWASPREVLNVVQADQVGCSIITMTTDLLTKLELLGKDLEEFSLDTVAMFHRDAKDAGLCL